MSEKKIFDRDYALKAGLEIMKALKPVTERIVIAGSIRRGKDRVHDCELLFIPKISRKQVDWFKDEPFNETEAMIQELLFREVIEKRPGSTGQFSWGHLNKLGMHVKSGVPIDLFATSEKNWWNSLVVRTGGKDNNLLITTTAQQMGWSFEAYGSGFRKVGTNERHETTSERDVYHFLKLEYLEPHERR